MYERSFHAAVFGLWVDRTTLDEAGSAAPAEAQRGHMLWLITNVCLWSHRVPTVLPSADPLKRARLFLHTVGSTSNNQHVCM